MEPFALILAAMLAQTEAATPPPPPPPVPVEADGDRAVSRQEWMARFDRLDADHDGRLTAEERRAGRPLRDGREPRRRRDDRPDGPPPLREATRAEFLARAAERFDRMDVNHDGRIDADEARRQPGRAEPRP